MQEEEESTGLPTRTFSVFSGPRGTDGEAEGGGRLSLGGVVFEADSITDNTPSWGCFEHRGTVMVWF